MSRRRTALAKISVEQPRLRVSGVTIEGGGQCDDLLLSVDADGDVYVQIAGCDNGSITLVSDICPSFVMRLNS